jgi:hypothetical protein
MKVDGMGTQQKLRSNAMGNMDPNKVMWIGHQQLQITAMTEVMWICQLQITRIMSETAMAAVGRSAR